MHNVLPLSVKKTPVLFNVYLNKNSSITPGEIIAILASPFMT